LELDSNPIDTASALTAKFYFDKELIAAGANAVGSKLKLSLDTDKTWVTSTTCKAAVTADTDKGTCTATTKWNAD
jgi:hypothetical protein